MMLFTATVLGCMCLLNMLSGFYLFDPKPDIRFHVKRIQYLYMGADSATCTRGSGGRKSTSTSTWS